jgi:hypothetical protein
MFKFHKPSCEWQGDSPFTHCFPSPIYILASTCMKDASSQWIKGSTRLR